MFESWLRPRTASRKYVDLIRDATSKWANWDPPTQIKAGDYGLVDGETGEFQVHGNVYTDHDGKAFGLEANDLPQTQAEEDTFEAASKKTVHHRLVLTPELSVPGLAEASIQGQWEFGTNRGALLIMARPRISSIPRHAMRKLGQNPALKGKSLVTAVFLCPAYSMYLSNGVKDAISLALLGKLPVPGAPGLVAGGEIGATWWKREASGVLRHACDKNWSYCYTPLYQLQDLRVFRRDGKNPGPDDLWVDSIPPWNPLDNDGEEIEMEDTIFDSD